MKQIAYTCNWSSISVSEMRDTYNHTLDVVGSSTAWIANHSNQSINALGFVLLHTLTHSLCLQCVPLSSHYHWPYCHTVAKMHNQLLCMPFVQVLCAPILSHCTEDINFIFRSFFFYESLEVIQKNDKLLWKVNDLWCSYVQLSTLCVFMHLSRVRWQFFFLKMVPFCCCCCYYTIILYMLLALHVMLVTIIIFRFDIAFLNVCLARKQTVKGGKEWWKKTTTKPKNVTSF